MGFKICGCKSKYEFIRSAAAIIFNRGKQQFDLAE